MDKASAARLISNELWPAFQAERQDLLKLDRWYRWDHDQPHSPRHSTTEYQQLAARAQTPWLGLVVTAVAQSLYVEGYRRADDPNNAGAWSAWQANGMDSRQIAVHRAALAYGLSYTVVLPGTSPLTGEPMAKIRGVDPCNMMAFYAEPAEDEWPHVALRADPAKVDGQDGWSIRLYDDSKVWRYQAKADGAALTYIEFQEHGLPVCPVVRYANMLDLRGRVPGEVEPYIPVAGRIDQTTFDRLVVQRFAAWVVRTIAGMSAPEALEGESQADYETRTKLRLKVEDILVADDPDTKFGSLPATPLEGFIAAKDADIRDLAAVTQTPPHHLLGQVANLSAEALAAAEAGLNRKVVERKHTFGESHEQTLRISALAMGDLEGARDTEAQVKWRDMESRSLAQVADALGKMATMLGVPVQMLWEKIPDWTQADVERAKSLMDTSTMDKLLTDLVRGTTSVEPVPQQ